MAVQLATAWQIYPGRIADMIERSRQAARLLESQGAQASLLLWGTAGANTGAANYLLNFADMDAWGAWSDRLPLDAEWQEWWAKNYTADGPGIILGQALLGDLPGFDTIPVEPGTFVQAWTGRLAPGRSVAEFVKTLEATKSLSLKHGALWMTARRCIAGGDFAGMIAFNTGFSSAAHYARARASFASDPAIAEVQEQVATGLVGQAISFGTVVPL